MKLSTQDIIGEFSISGTNQDAERSTYKGTLTLKLDENKRIQARWNIFNDQEQFGTGFFKNNILVINFNYQGIDDRIFKGVVVYQCLSRDIFEGFWSEKHGDPVYLGEEHCFRIRQRSELPN